MEIEATIYKNENDEFVASEKYGFKQYHFSNKGRGYEFFEGQEVIIHTYDEIEDKKIVRKFYKVVELYDVEINEDGINYDIIKYKKAGEEILSVEEIAFNSFEQEDLPKEVKIKILFMNKKRKKYDLALLSHFEELKFSMQSGHDFFDSLDLLKNENPDVQIEFEIGVKKPFVTIFKNGYKRKFELNWDYNYQMEQLINAGISIPSEIADKLLREINANDLLLTDIKISEDGNYIIINGKKIYFKNKNDKDKLKDLNPDLYKKICMVMAGKIIDEATKEKIKIKYKELEKIEELEKMEEVEMDKSMDYSNIISFKKYLDSLIAKETQGSLYKITIDNNELVFYIGDKQNISMNEFKDFAKAIIEEQLKDLDEIKGWGGTIDIINKNRISKNKISEINISKEK